MTIYKLFHQFCRLLHNNDPCNQAMAESLKGSVFADPISPLCLELEGPFLLQLYRSRLTENSAFPPSRFLERESHDWLPALSP